jgi:hypothetical protein
MKRLVRTAWAFSAALSSALLLLVLFFWARSYSILEAVSQLKTLDPPKATADAELRRIGPTSARREFSCHLLRGTIVMSVAHMSTGGFYPADMPAPDGWTRTSLPAAGMLASYPSLPASTLGFGYEHRQCRVESLMADQLDLRGVPASSFPKLPPLTETWTLQIPCWPLAAAAAVVLLAAVFSLRGRRQPVGHCRRCGYDLRASTVSCPECGHLR